LVFLAGAGLLVFFQAAIKYVSCEWCFSQKAIRFGALIISLNLNMVALITFAWTEIKTLKRKKEIINKYSQREPGSK
jgi:hypothetical protein